MVTACYMIKQKAKLYKHSTSICMWTCEQGRRQTGGRETGRGRDAQRKPEPGWDYFSSSFHIFQIFYSKLYFAL